MDPRPQRTIARHADHHNEHAMGSLIIPPNIAASIDPHQGSGYVAAHASA
jgi:hypothetical protein